jgi:hypothetical protein
MTGDDRLSSLQLTRLTTLADSAGARPAGTFAVAVFHAQRNGAQMESGLFGKLERRHGASLTFSVAAV